MLYKSIYNDLRNKPYIDNSTKETTLNFPMQIPNALYMHQIMTENHCVEGLPNARFLINI